MDYKVHHHRHRHHFIIVVIIIVIIYYCRHHHHHYYFSPTEGDSEDEVVCGAHVRDSITGEEFDVRAKCVVNATGPFTDAVRQMDDPTGTKICQPSAGVHIVLPEYYRYAL